MYPNSPKNRKLVRKYPFLVGIINTRLEPYGVPLHNQIDDLTIRVEIADGELMYRQAHNAGLADWSYAFCTSGIRSDQLMRRGEYIFAVGGEGEILNSLRWPGSDEEQRTMNEVYGYQVMWTGRVQYDDGSKGLADPIWDKVEYLVWITVEAWHSVKKAEEWKDMLGEFRERNVYVTIYRKPNQGFRKLDEESDIFQHLFLHHGLMMRNRGEQLFKMMEGMLHEMCIWFQKEVYFNGMREVVEQSRHYSASGQFGPVCVTCMDNQVRLEDDMSVITFQVGHGKMYVVGQEGTLPRIRNLVRTLIREWNNEPEQRSALKPN